MQKSLLKFGTVLTLATVFALMNIGIASAATGDFTIYPTYRHGDNINWIVGTAEQGATIEDYVTIENLTENSLNIKLRTKDATEEGNNYILNDKNQAIAAWTQLKEDHITLAPYEKRQIPVSITIPENAATQNYTAAILASKSEKNSQDLTIVTEIGVRIYLDVTEAKPLGADIFTSAKYTSGLFFILSLTALLGSISYNIIYYREQKKYA